MPIDYVNEFKNDLVTLLKQKDKKKDLGMYLAEKIYSECNSPAFSLKLDNSLSDKNLRLNKRNGIYFNLNVFGVSNKNGFFDYRYNIYLKRDKEIQQAFLNQLYFLIKKLNDDGKIKKEDSFRFKPWHQETFCVYLSENQCGHFISFLKNELSRSLRDEYKSLTGKDWRDIRKSDFDDAKPYFFGKVMDGVFCAPSVFNMDAEFLENVFGCERKEIPFSFSISRQIIGLVSYALSDIKLRTSDKKKTAEWVVGYLDGKGWEPRMYK